MGLVGLGAALATLLVPAAGRAADSIYWTDFVTGSVRVGNLDGTGTPRTLYGATNPEAQLKGIALDPATGKIYWSAYDSKSAYNRIRVGNLDGTGSPQTVYPMYGGSGLAVDHPAGKIYWSGITVGNLNGTGTPQNYFGSSPYSGGYYGLAIDPSGGKGYFTVDSQTIEVGELDGSGTLSSAISGETSVLGVAFDPETTTLYWSNSTSPGGAIRYGAPGGSGATLFSATNPYGVAIDPTGGQIYWASGNPEEIRHGSLSGGTASKLFDDNGGPYFLAILRSPTTRGAPLVSGGTRAGQPLACTTGHWAADIVPAQLYRAPHSFAYQWLRSGSPVAGAKASNFTPLSAGSYSCRVTASNQAGSTLQTSAARTIAPPEFGPRTRVTLGLKSSSIPAAGPVKFVVSNVNFFGVTGQLSGETAKAVAATHRRRIKLGPVSFAVGAHARKTVSVALPKALQRLLKSNHHLSLVMAAKVRDPAGDARTITKSVTVKLA